MRTLTLLSLLAVSTPAVAQHRDLLPMSYVRVDAAVARRLATDWERQAGLPLERVYCVTSWTTALSQDGDTAFVITGVRPAPARARPHEATRFDCPGERGSALPLVHTHPGGDCSVSRADASNALAYEVPFGLIQCGQHAWSGYTRAQYLLMQRGVWYARSTTSP